MKGLLENSKELKSKIMIYYIDTNNEVTQRIISVVEIKREHVIAYCHYRKQVRSFKFENILSCVPVKRRVGA
ncbi:hypothetical protein AQ616_17370 [Oceanobacillus sp. E9]|uniref:hypothetical protein n=1 Tax=Oceanobacillus TaxID=182709 RepID=UPI00084E719C|nr:hypothetical protein [Oceanobacillus sp. E9]OEH53466.1 hypothetical protein AQ616_17370 [Oceanobacillus sp. E9]